MGCLVSFLSSPPNMSSPDRTKRQKTEDKRNHDTEDEEGHLPVYRLKHRFVWGITYRPSTRTYLVLVQRPKTKRFSLVTVSSPEQLENRKSWDSVTKLPGLDGTTSICQWTFHPKLDRIVAVGEDRICLIDPNDGTAIGLSDSRLISPRSVIPIHVAINYQGTMAFLVQTKGKENQNKFRVVVVGLSTSVIRVMPLELVNPTSILFVPEATETFLVTHDRNKISCFTSFSSTIYTTYKGEYWLRSLMFYGQQLYGVTSRWSEGYYFGPLSLRKDLIEFVHGVLCVRSDGLVGHDYPRYQLCATSYPVSIEMDDRGTVMWCEGEADDILYTLKRPLKLPL